jgi:hypothetical protein
MKAITFLGAGVAIAALAGAAPAAAQYYPGNGYGYGNPVGQVLNSVFGGGFGYNGNGVNSQAAVNQCAGAVQARLGGGYGYNGYGYAGGGRVLGISRVEPRSSGGLTVRGVASSGRYAGYGAQAPVDLTWRCRTDYGGFVTDVRVEPAQSNYGANYGYAPQGYAAAPQPQPYDYSQYGYRRY